MVALVVSILIVAAGVGICLAVGRRRPPGTPVTWGEAFVAGTFVFALMVVAYGVVPHQWLDFADNELLWRPDRILLGISSSGIELGDTARQMQGSGRILISYQAVRDIVAAGLYIVFLVAQMMMWSRWQKRDRLTTELEPTSRFGRPVIRKA